MGYSSANGGKSPLCWTTPLSMFCLVKLSCSVSSTSISCWLSQSYPWLSPMDKYNQLQPHFANYVLLTSHEHSCEITMFHGFKPQRIKLHYKSHYNRIKTTRSTIVVGEIPLNHNIQCMKSPWHETQSIHINPIKSIEIHRFSRKKKSGLPASEAPLLRLPVERHGLLTAQQWKLPLQGGAPGDIRCTGGDYHMFYVFFNVYHHHHIYIYMCVWWYIYIYVCMYVYK